MNWTEKTHYFRIFGIAILLISGWTYPNEAVYHGASDVSTAVFLNDNHFVVADDETNSLRVYDPKIPGKPVFWLDLTAFLGVESSHPEADMEASAPVGDRIYWITSHGRNRDGKPRPSRYRFFSTVLRPVDGRVQLEPVGLPCSTLVSQFLAHPSSVQGLIARSTRLDASLSKKEQTALAPKEKGLNIEGLAVYPPHQSLLIGLRNPLFSPTGKKGGSAIIIELLNPQAVVDTGDPARFGEVLFWDLEDRGVRSMHYSERHKMYFIVAGAVDSETTFALYRWDGDFERQPVKIHQWPKKDSFNPEAIAERAFDGLLWIFSDDGTLKVAVDSPYDCAEGELLKNNQCPNKYLTDPMRKTFRVRKLDPKNPQ